MYISFKGNAEDNIDAAHRDAKLLFWSERQTKFGSPSVGYHEYLQYYGDSMLPSNLFHTLPRSLYWARREVLEATRSRNDPDIFQHRSATDIESTEKTIREMEKSIDSSCANCHQKRSKTLHLNFCNR